MSAKPEPRDDPKSLLARARRTTDDLEARLLLGAAVAEAGRECGVRAVITGGTAADFFATGALGTSAAYPALWRPSSDLDVVVVSVGEWKPAREALIERLVAIGLRPRYLSPGQARIVDVPDFPFYLELVSEELGSRERDERTMTLLIDDRVPLEIRSPENVILAYAESGWHLRHTGDWTRALAVFTAMAERLDVEWMRLEAARRGQGGVLERVMRREPLMPPRPP